MISPPIIKILAAVGYTAFFIFVGWQVQGWRKDIEILQMKSDAEEARANVAQDALEDLAEASSNMRLASEKQLTDQRATNEKLSIIAAQIKTLRPLPVDCRPDAARLQLFKDAIDATNASATRR
jgi:hypothetical protein